jgi:predicted transcriptional regulator
MPQFRRSNGELARDRKLIAGMYLKGYTQSEIAIEVGLSQQTVSRDIKSLHKEWREDSLIDFDEAKARELGKMKRGAGDKARGYREMTNTVKGQVGDPRFLTIVDRCIDRRCKIFGLDAPQKRELTGKGGAPLIPDDNTIRIVVYDDEESE